MVKGMMMDIPDKVVYKTWDDLYLYCYRVASTVGLMTLPVMGTAPGVTLEAAKDPAVALGIALQITNILRCVCESERQTPNPKPLTDYKHPKVRLRIRTSNPKP